MNAQGSVDLSYADPEPSPQLLGQVQERGRRLRRRRRIGSAAGGVILLAALALGGQAILGHQGGSVSPSAAPDRTPVAQPAKLPARSGHDASAKSLVKPADGKNHVESQGSSTAPAGPATVIAPTQNGKSATLLWVSTNASLVAGNRSGNGHLQAMLSKPLNSAPAQGFWGQVKFSDYAGPPDLKGEVRWMIAGLIRGPVTDVVIALPSGNVTAHLGPAPVPALGTFYWLTTDDFNSSGRAVSPTASWVKDITSVTATAYRGTQPVFRCQDSNCLSPS